MVPYSDNVEYGDAISSRWARQSRRMPPTGVPTIPEKASVPENARDAAVVSCQRPIPTAMAGPKVENPITAPL